MKDTQITPLQNNPTLTMTGITNLVAPLLMIVAFVALFTLGLFHSTTPPASISLRYNVPISGQTAFHARQYSIQNSYQNETFWPTFWHQSAATLASPIREVHSSTILFSGDANLVWHATYLLGTAPSAIDDHGIAISYSLAHNLFGSISVIGKQVYANGTPRYIRGVFEGQTDLALLSFHIENTSQYFTAVELTGRHLSRTNIQHYVITSALGMPNFILMPMSISRVMAFAPLLIPIIYLLVSMIKFTRRYKTPIIFVCATVFAALLPFLLNLIPPQLIPTHFSDFSFWSNLLRQTGDDLRQLLSVNPTLRDIEKKIHLLQQAGIFFITVCAGILTLHSLIVGTRPNPHCEFFGIHPLENKKLL